MVGTVSGEAVALVVVGAEDDDDENNVGRLWLLKGRKREEEEGMEAVDGRTGRIFLFIFHGGFR